MASSIPCPLCGSAQCRITENYDCLMINCNHFNVSINILRETIDDYYNEPIFSKLANVMVEYILRKKVAPNKAFWVFYYAPQEITPNDNPAYVNLSPYMTTYPKTVTEYVDRILLNISIKYPEYGRILPTPAEDCRLYYPDYSESKLMAEHANNIVKIIMEFCCKNDVFEDKDRYVQPHFDIAQTSQIRWKNEEDLIKRLKKRIDSTVGRIMD